MTLDSQSANSFLQHLDAFFQQLDFLSAYPRWFSISVYTLILALVIWIASKLLKAALWILLALVVLGGAYLAVRHLFGR